MSKNNQNVKKQETCIIFARTSAGTGQSIAEQVMACKTLAETEGWKVTKVFTEEGTSLHGRPMNFPIHRWNMVSLPHTVQQLR